MKTGDSDYDDEDSVEEGLGDDDNVEEVKNSDLRKQKVESCRK